MRLTVVFIAALAASAPAVALHAPDGAAYAIANPQRPGAKAPDCTTLDETRDGCTFHNEHGVTQHALLPLADGERWTARAGDADELRVQVMPPAQQDGRRLQRIAFTPQVHRDADTTLTFDRIRGSGSSAQLVERRRVSVMIHQHGPHAAHNDGHATAGSGH